MPRKGSRQRPPLSRMDAEGFGALLAEHLEWMRVRQYTDSYCAGREKGLVRFAEWCLERNVTRPSEVTKPMVERYQRWLFYRRRSDGRPTAARTQYAQLQAVRGFFKWLSRAGRIAYSPAADLELPRLPMRLSGAVLSEAEVQRVLAVPDAATSLGVRDRALMELLYATGLRRAEACAVKVTELDFEQRLVLVREGKGKKDRLLPMGPRAAAWLEKYVLEVRPDYVRGLEDGFVFLREGGEPLDKNYLTHLVRWYVKKAQVNKPGSCHLFRHSMATHMLDGGADIRFVQQMLGHANISATQIYTHVAVRKLVEVHGLTHPGVRLVRSEKTGDESAEVDESELLAALEVEGAEEEGAEIDE